MNQKNSRIAYYGLFTALAIIMGYVELLIPMPVPIPGMKLGLANIIVLLVLYTMGKKAAIAVSLVRVLLSGLLFAGFAGLLYSLAGAVFSLVMMLLLFRTGKFSIIGVSLVGGIFHNIGQVLVASMVVENVKLFYYLPFLLVSGVFTGIVIGMVARLALGYLNRRF